MNEAKTIASHELLMEQLSNRDWDQLWIRLMARCTWLLRNRYQVKWDKEKRKDFSHEAICEIITKIFVTKKRRWNLTRYPDFEDFIVGAIDSQINNTLNETKVEEETDDEGFISNANEETEPSPADIVISKELHDEIYAELKAAGADEKELMIFECLAEGIEKPEEIKTILELSDQDFHNSWRRFKRKREIIKAKLAAHGY